MEAERDNILNRGVINNKVKKPTEFQMESIINRLKSK